MTSNVVTRDARPSRIFAQYLNPEILDLYGSRARLTSSAFLRAVLVLSRWGVLIGQEGIVFPQTYLVEVPEMDAVLTSLTAARNAGLVAFSSASPEGRHLLEKKRREYRSELELFPGYAEGAAPPDLENLIWVPRIERSSWKDIARDWHEQLGDGGLWERIVEEGARRRLNRLPYRLEAKIGAVPSHLGGQAFVFRYAAPLLPIPLSTRARQQVAGRISRAYLLSNVLELDGAILTDTTLGGLDCGLVATHPERVVSVQRIAELAGYVGVRRHIETAVPLPALLQLRGDPIWHWFAAKAIEEQRSVHRPLYGAMLAARFRPEPGRDRRRTAAAVRDHLWRLREAVEQEELPSQLELGTAMDLEPTGEAAGRRTRGIHSRLRMPGQQALRVNTNDVFLVHGRDTEAAEATKTLLRTAHINPVEWSEAKQWTRKATPYVLEVLQAAFNQVQAVVVLFTPDDDVELCKDFLRADDPAHEKSRGQQPRPNVLVEAGMALALHGDRTVIIEIGKNRPMTDLEGLHVIRFDGSAHRRAEVIEALETAGCRPRGKDYLASPGFEYLASRNEKGG